MFRVLRFRVDDYIDLGVVIEKKTVLFSWSPWIAEVSPITFNDLALDWLV